MVRRKTTGESASGRLGDQPGMLFDRLEPRVLLSGFEWTGDEVFLAELVNRARLDPAVEAARLGLDLTSDLTPAELARFTTQEPLALNAELTVAARDHALDMAQRGFFDHVNPDGEDPTDRAVRAGYAGVAGENIAAGQDSISIAHAAWLDSLGHRRNVLSLHDNFTDTFHYNEIGIGFAFTNIAPYFDFYAQSFGFVDNDVFLLGVVTDDLNNNNFYDSGEGISGIQVDVFTASEPSNILFSYTTHAAGNYQMRVDPGSYVVRYTNLASGLVYADRVTIDSVNVKLDVAIDQITLSPDDPNANFDDHANAGQLAFASSIPVNSITGDGGLTGVIESTSDVDLFSFVPVQSGLASILMGLPNSTLQGSIRLLDDAGQPLQAASQSAPGQTLTSTFWVVQNQTYYIEVLTENQTVGEYAIFVGSPGTADSGPAADYTARSGQTIGADAGADGSLIVTSFNASGRPLALNLNAQNQWSASDLLQVAGGPDDAGSIKTWIDPVDGSAFAALTSAEGLFVYHLAADGSWAVRNLTRETAGSSTIVSDLTVFTSTDNRVSIAGLDTQGDLLRYTKMGSSDADGRSVWAFQNIAEDQLRVTGQVVPQFVGPIISYVTSWNGLNIAGLDAQGQIHAVWWAPGQATWRTSNLSSITGAPTLTGGLTAYLTSWKGINLAGIDVNGQLSVAWWVPQFGASWRTSNLSSLVTGSQALLSESLSSYVTPWGGLNISGLDSNGKVSVFWWAPGLDSWRFSPLSDLVTGSRTLAGTITGVTTNAGEVSLIGRSDTDELIRYHWRPGTAWSVQNITSVLQA